MLILTRGKGESIEIGDGLTLTVIAIAKTRVGLLLATDDNLDEITLSMGESRDIGSSTAVKYLSQRGEKWASLGFDAPKEVIIVRTEKVEDRD